jgi:type III pantothenate kinase
LPFEAVPKLAAVDIGNSSIRIVSIAAHHGSPLIGTTLATQPGESTEAFIARLAATSLPPQLIQVPWVVSSVAPEKTNTLRAFHRQHLPNSNWREVIWRDSPYSVRVDLPDRVGIDRIMASVGAYQRAPKKSVIVIDAGTAITVDLTDVHGDFCGGAIAPGPGMQIDALARNTSQLPSVALDLSVPPNVLGKNTEAAIRAGVFWGTIGTIKELLQKMVLKASSLDDEVPQIFITGGAGKLVGQHLSEVTSWVPHLVLEGVFHTAAHRKWFVPPPSGD